MGEQEPIHHTVIVAKGKPHTQELGHDEKIVAEVIEKQGLKITFTTPFLDDWSKPQEQCQTYLIYPPLDDHGEPLTQATFSTNTWDRNKRQIVYTFQPEPQKAYIERWY